MATVRIMLKDGVYEDVDLNQLSPTARALAEAIADSPMQTLSDIWVETDQPIRDLTPDWRHWYTEEEASLLGRRSWRGWAKYPTTYPLPAREYLEREAGKIPAGWHILGASPDQPIPSYAIAGQADEAGQEMNVDQVLAYLHGKGRYIRPSTWRSYAARGQAPEPVRHIGRTPLWQRGDIDAWLAR